MIALLAKWLAYPQHFILYHILKLWLFCLVTIVTSAWLLRGHRVSVAPGKTAGGAGLKKPSQKTLHNLDYASITLLVVIVCALVFLLYYHADFACFDCTQLMDFPLSGHPFPPLWAHEGRFFPLGFQEFNFLRHVTHTPAGFQSVASLELVVLVSVLFVVLKECRISWRGLIIIAVVTNPTFVISFTGMIYPERNVLFFLAILILCLQNTGNNHSPIFFVGCFAATQFLLYYKEPLVVLIVVYATSQILMNYLYKWNAMKRSWKRQLQENIVPLGMIVVAGVYSTIFLIFMFPYPFAPSYYIQHFGKRATPLTYLSTDLVLSLFIIVCFVRVVRSAFAKHPLDPLWDSLAFGALAYFFAILATGIYAEYYLAPTDFIALLYLGRLTKLRVGSTFYWRTAAVGLTYVCLVVFSVATSTLLLLEAKESVIRTSELASFLKEYRTDVRERSIELYFPKMDGFQIAGLSSYLHYKGIRIAGFDDPAGGDIPEFVFAGPDIYPLGRCVPYKPYPCKHTDKPQAGGLIVILPGDVVEKRDVEEFAKGSTLLLSATSWPEKSPMGRGLRLLSTLSLLHRETHHRPQPWWQFYIFRNAKQKLDTPAA